jgi:hypothetical protein
MKNAERITENISTREMLTIEEAKELLRVIKEISDPKERLNALDQLLHAFAPDADGRKIAGPRGDFFEAVCQLYLFEKTLYEKRVTV